MKESMAIFENEDAERLLCYFVSYKEVVTNMENKPSPEMQKTVEVALLPKEELLITK